MQEKQKCVVRYCTINNHTSLNDSMNQIDTVAVMQRKWRSVKIATTELTQVNPFKQCSELRIPILRYNVILTTVDFYTMCKIGDSTY